MGALFDYMQQAQLLIRDARQELVNPTDLITYINQARGQLAGEAQCVVDVGTLSLVAAQQVYRFDSILTGGNGISFPINVRTMWYGVGTGQVWIRPRPWPWFSLYQLNNPAPTPGPPKIWSQYAQGVKGTFYVAPVPDQAYSILADCICYPDPLAADTDFEAIPYLWTDAIPFYAAYLALLTMQTQSAAAEADKMFGKYQEYVARARQAATPPVLPTIYAQSPNPVRAGQLGMTTQPRGGQ